LGLLWRRCFCTYQAAFSILSGVKTLPSLEGGSVYFFGQGFEGMGG
jgi:hypothetical protein